MAPGALPCYPFLPVGQKGSALLPPLTHDQHTCRPAEPPPSRAPTHPCLASARSSPSGPMVRGLQVQPCSTLESQEPFLAYPAPCTSSLPLAPPGSDQALATAATVPGMGLGVLGGGLFAGPDGGGAGGCIRGLPANRVSLAAAQGCPGPAGANSARGESQGVGVWLVGAVPHTCPPFP